MFEIKTNTRRYIINDEDGEMYFNACMETLLGLETNEPMIELVEKIDPRKENPSIGGGFA